MHVMDGISFTDDIREVSNKDGSLVSGVNKYEYTGYHIPTKTRYRREVYVVGDLEEVCHILNEWNTMVPDIWQYSIDWMPLLNKTVN